jgi:hypothetical protein
VGKVIAEVLLGGGTRFFGEEGQRAELELTRAIDAPGVAHLTFGMPR